MGSRSVHYTCAILFFAIFAGCVGLSPRMMRDLAPHQRFTTDRRAAASQ